MLRASLYATALGDFKRSKSAVSTGHFKGVFTTKYLSVGLCDSSQQVLARAG
jgi:hypothetical protein